MAVNVDTSKCTGSGECIDTCPVEALSLENGKAVVDEDECIDCGACVEVCPNGALSL